MKVLFIRFSSIGDIVLTFPVVRCVAAQVPNVTIHYLTKPVYTDLLRACPGITVVKTLEESLWKTAQQLRLENYDYVIDLHHNLRSEIIRRLLGTKSKAFPKLNFEKWLLTKFNINRLPKKHVVDRYFEAVSELRVKNDDKRTPFLIPISSQQFVDEKFDLPEKFIAVSMGAQFATKQIPIEKLIEILQSVDGTVVLLGGKEDTKRALELTESLKKNQLINLCGELPLLSSAYVVSKASKLLTGDTGLMHIASFFDVEIISVWGNTVPDFGMFPYRSKEQATKDVIFKVDDLSCRPCSKIGHSSCPKGHFKCMLNQDTNAIVKTIKA